MSYLLSLFFVSDGGYRPYSKCPCHRDHNAGKTRVSARHEKGVPLFYLALNEKIEIRCGECLGDSRRLHHRAVFRNGHQHIVFYRHVFGVATAAEKSAHLVADLPRGILFCRLAHLDYLARHLKSHPFGTAGRGRVAALTLKQICAVDSRRLDLDQHLVILYYRIGNLVPP